MLGVKKVQAPVSEDMMRKHFPAVVACIVGLASIVSASASADELADVKAKGTMSCGVLGSFEPFGFVSRNRELQGYDVDMCNALAKRIGVTAEVRPMAIDARIPELQAGRVDIMAAGLAYTAQRATQVDFSDGYYVSPHILAVRVDHGINKVSDLNGRRIAFTKGGIAENYVKKEVPGAILVGLEDTPTAFTSMAQGKSDAISVSEEVASRLVNKLGPAATQFKILEPPIGSEIWGFGVRKGEEPFLKAVNIALEDIERSGEAQQIFDKWLGPNTLYKMTREFKISPIPRTGAVTPNKGAQKAAPPAGWKGHLSILTPQNIKLLASGIAATVILSVGSWLLAFIFGTFLAIIRMTRIRVLEWLVIAFVEYQRCVPPLVHIFLWYFGVSNLLPVGLQQVANAHHGEMYFAALAIGLYYAAYVSEDIRSGLRSVSYGQHEAARAVGFNYLSAMRYIIMPQALRNAIPPMVSGSVLLMKTTSLAMVVGAVELTYATKEIANSTFKAFDIYGLSTAIYVGIALALMWAGAALARRFHIPSR
ncbi:ABC transporter substrate-binding protein/permease [Caballeronia sp. LZ016]|uniref:ABC transporter substrate-binding protein/permease n=1 Tax=Caballeronia sp. LZ016 TaxID=3038554 RepID=UPI002861D2FA|nr:ABC transporter substrate-binding protein/permease [Caballeronia sp. LZ016]MDR5740212.1 ABC transporter substrate-binding protein/permease [Caballeronia sp. LZ016]